MWQLVIQLQSPSNESLSDYMTLFPKTFISLCALIAMTAMANAQQSTPAPSSSAPGSLAPLSNGIPQLGNYTAAAKGSQVVYNHSTVRLIAGDYVDGVWTAGVEIVLAPGWKTYWRVPGDAGVPSDFVWDKSDNVKSADVSWPAPKRYEDITGKSTGYKKHVVFPVKVTAKDSSIPAKLDLQLYYAICSDICVPAQANLALALPVDLTSTPAMEVINEFAAKVPSSDAKGLKINNVQSVSVGGSAVLAVTLTGNIDPKTDILVEGSDSAYFAAPKFASKAGGKQVFHLAIDGLDSHKELSGKTLKLTVLSGEIRLEADVEVN